MDEDIVVAVIDSAVDFSHPDLAADLQEITDILFEE